jgi:hypothetical protein
MPAGKVASPLLLVLAAAVCAGCQTGPDRPAVARAQPKAPPQADPTKDPSVRAAAPLRITEPPGAVATSAPPDGLPALPDVPAPGAAPASIPGNSPAAAESPLRRLHRLASEEYARMDGYQVRLTRREQVNGKDQPKEIIRLDFRKEPWSAHLVWLEGENKGREVVYVKGRFGDKVHTRLGPTDGNVLMRPGSRVSLAPDNPLVRGSSRHAITDAGAGSMIDRFGSLLAANEKGDRRSGTLTYRGPEKRPEFSNPVEVAEQLIPPGADKDLPRGGRRLWAFGTAPNHLPALVVTTDDRGHEVEYYLHDRYIPIRLDDRDFDPDVLWGK